jgi:hypothetical protein
MDAKNIIKQNRSPSPRGLFLFVKTLLKASDRFINSQPEFKYTWPRGKQK